MKPKKERYYELYEQVKMIVEVTESESRLAKLFPQSSFQIGKTGKQVEAMKKKNFGSKGKYHSVVKMKRSSVVGKKDPEELGPEEMQDEQSPLNNGLMSPEESIRGMQDPVQMAQELLSQGMEPEEIGQYFVSQGMSEEEVAQILQQILEGGDGEQNPEEEETPDKSSPKA